MVPALDPPFVMRIRVWIDVVQGPKSQYLIFPYVSFGLSVRGLIWNNIYFTSPIFVYKKDLCFSFRKDKWWKGCEVQCDVFLPHSPSLRPPSHLYLLAELRYSPWIVDSPPQHSIAEHVYQRTLHQGKTVLALATGPRYRYLKGFISGLYFNVLIRIRILNWTCGQKRKQLFYSF